MRYNAFLSYSHAADGRLAPALQSALRRFAKPWYRRRAVRIFRDKTSLSATPALWPSIEKSLSESEWFLLLASPESATSQWVGKEVDWWLTNRGVEKMLVLLSSGELSWNQSAGDFDWHRTTALTGNLEGRFKDEPLWVDLRWARTAETLSLRHSRFREAILDISAPLRAVAKEDLDGEDVRQHRRTLTVAWTAFVMILVFAGVAEWQRQTAVSERDSANDFLGRLQVTNGLQSIQDDDLWGALAWFAEAWRWDHGNEARVETHRVRIGTWLRNTPKLLQVWFHGAPINSVEFSPDGTRVVTASGVAYRKNEDAGEARVWDAITGSPVTPPLRHRGTVYSASFSPDGSRVVTAGGDHSARVWNADTGEELTELQGHQGAVRRAVFSPNGRWIATASADQTARVWQAGTGKPVSAPLEHRRSVWEVAFSPDGKRLLTTTMDPFKKFPGEARVWDPATGEPITAPMKSGNSILDGEFSPDGRHLVTANSDGTAVIWDSATGEPIHKPLQHDKRVTHASFSPDGRLVLTTSEDGTARMWNVDSGLPLTLGGKTERSWIIFSGDKGAKIKHAAFSPDGSHVATIDTTRTARVWDAKTARPLTPPLLHSERKYPLAGRIGDPGETPGAEAVIAFGPGGLRLVTASWDGTARIWDLVPDALASQLIKADFSVRYPPTLTLPGPYPVFSPDGSRAVLIQLGKTARIWDTSTGRPVTPLLVHTEKILHAAFSPDGTHVVTTTGANYAYERSCSAQVWDAVTGIPVSPPITHTKGIAHASFSPDGRRLVTASYDNTARVWDVQTSQPITPPLEHDNGVLHAEFSPDGRWVVTASKDRTARIWHAETGESVLPPLKHSQEVTRASFSIAGDTILTTSTGYHDGQAQVWYSRTGTAVGPPLKQHDHLNWASLSPDGNRVVTASADGVARVWNARTSAPVSPLLLHEGTSAGLFREQAGVISASFSPDGRWVVTTAADGIAQVWDTESGQPITPPLEHNARVGLGRFSQDGHHLFTGSSDGTARVWNLAPDPRDMSYLTRLVQLLGARKVDDSGALIERELSNLEELWFTLRTERPEDFATTSEDLSEGHKLRAAKAEAQGDWASAVFHLDRAIAYDPERASLYSRRAIALAASGKRERAVESMTTSIELGADNWPARQMRGHLFLELRQWKEAATDYAQAINLGVSDPSVWCDHALLRLATGDLEGYHWAVQRLLEHPDLRASGSQLIERFLRLLLMDPETPSDKANALTLLEDWLALKTYTGMKARLTGPALYRAGRLDEAVEKLEQSLQRQQPADRPWMRLFLAMAKHDIGNHAEAKEQLALSAKWLDQTAMPMVQKGATQPQPTILDLTSQASWRRSLEVEILHREVERSFSNSP